MSFDSYKAWIKITYMNREEGFAADALTVAAIERAVRKRLAAGKGFFLTCAAADPTWRNKRMTLFVSPHAHLSFSYVDPVDHVQLTHTVEAVERMLEEHGGIALDENDMLTEPPV